MNFNATQIVPPKYWQTFEDLCLAIFRRVCHDSTATKNGRTGQPQNGTDISGRPRDTDGFHGVPCKDKDIYLGSDVTEVEFNAEIAKAEKFTPAHERWILVSTTRKTPGWRSMFASDRLSGNAMGNSEFKYFFGRIYNLLSHLTQMLLKNITPINRPAPSGSWSCWKRKRHPRYSQKPIVRPARN